MNTNIKYCQLLALFITFLRYYIFFFETIIVIKTGLLKWNYVERKVVLLASVFEAAVLLSVSNNFNKLWLIH